MVITVDDCGLEWNRSDGIIHKADYDDLIESYEELKKYEDAEEQGILLRMPCKPGDDVYIIPSKTNYDLNVLHKCEGYNRVYHQKAHRVTVADGHWSIECDKDNEYGTGRILTDISYKKTWFLNEPEAEKALAEMG